MPTSIDLITSLSRLNPAAGPSKRPSGNWGTCFVELITFNAKGAQLIGESYFVVGDSKIDLSKLSRTVADIVEAGSGCMMLDRVIARIQKDSEGT